MELQAMTCENCHADVSTLGDAFVWLDRPVCKTCFDRLKASSSLRTRSFWMPLAIAATAVALILGIIMLTRKPVPLEKIAGTADLRAMISGTKWEWDVDNITFLPDGLVKQPTWEEHGLETRWTVADRRTVVLLITKGREERLTAVLKFNEPATVYDATNFEGIKLLAQKKLPESTN